MNIRKLWTELFQKPADHLILYLVAGALLFAFLFSGKGHRSTGEINPSIPAQATTAKGYTFTEEIPFTPPVCPPVQASRATDTPEAYCLHTNSVAIGFTGNTKSLKPC